MTRNPEIDLDLIATNVNGERVSLKKLRCDEASEMLGIWLAPSGSKERTIRVPKLAAIDWACNMRLGYSSPEEA